MCGSKRPATTTTTTAPPPEVMAAYRRLLERAEPLADTPYQEYTGDRIADFTPDQLQAFQGVRDAQGLARPYLDRATEYATIGADPITGAQIANYQNPYQQQVIDATMADFGTQNARQLSEVRGNAAARGALGGNRVAVAEALTQEQQNRVQNPIIANLRSQGWNSALGAAQADRSAAAQGAYTFGNLGNQSLSSSLTGANALYGMGSQQQALDQAGLNVPYEYFQERRAYPFQTTSWLSGITSGLGSQMGGTSTSSAPPPSIWNSVIGAAGTAAGAYMMSDERSKDNIIPIGEMFDGTPLYRFNYKGSDETQVGVMAQDVEKRDPGAVARGPGGMKMVNYDRATAPSAMRGEYAKGGSVGDIPGSGFMDLAGDPMLGGVLGMFGDESQIANSLLGFGLGGLAYNAIKGKAEGGGVMPYSRGYIPMMPIARGPGAPRGGAPAPAQQDNAAGNALQNLASMYRRRPQGDVGRGSWDAEVMPAMPEMNRGGVVPRGYDDGGVVWPDDLPGSPPQMQTLGQPMFIGPTQNGVPAPAISGDDAMSGEGTNAAGMGGRFFDGASAGFAPGQAIVPDLLGPHSFSGSAVPAGTNVDMVSTGQRPPTGVVPSGGAPQVAGALMRPRTFATPAIAPPPIAPPSGGIGGGVVPAGGGGGGSGGGSGAPAQSNDPTMRNIGLALMMAGLRTMASRSPWAGVAIGEGGQAGVQTYMQADQQHRTNQFTQQQIDLRARQLAEQARHHRASEGANRFQLMPGLPGQDAIRFNTRTGEATNVPVQIGARGGAGGAATAWQVRRDAWLAANPGDNQGALDYAVGRRAMPPAQIRSTALQVAQREATGLGLAGQRYTEHINRRARELEAFLAGGATPPPANPPPADNPNPTTSGGGGTTTPQPQSQPGVLSNIWQGLTQGSGAVMPSPAQQPPATASGNVNANVPPGRTDPRPPGVPPGSVQSQTTRQWRDPSGRIYDAQGRPVSGTGN